MSNYKVGDEILIKAKITDVEPADYYPYVVTTLRGQKTWATDDDIAEVPEDEYNRGLKDAWELARKIVLDVSKGGIPERDMRSMFGEKWTVSDILKNFTPQEALAKIEAYEKEQEKFKRGDIVEYIDTNEMGIYIGQWISGKHSVVFDDCDVPQDVKTEDIRKTGKHIDIASLLAALRGAK